MKAPHFSALGSVRGLAALFVCLSHVALAYPLPHTFRLLFDTAVNAHGAVVLFFILSGFVLCHSWKRFPPRTTSIILFYLRRAFRILPTLWVVTTIAIIFLAIAPPPAVGTFSEWFMRFNHPLSKRDIVLGYLVMDNEVLPPVWTIYVELGGSLAIPALTWLLSRNRRTALLALLALAIIAVPASALPNAFWPAVYMVDFGIGIALALYPIAMNRRLAISAAVVGMLLLTVGRPLFFLLQTGMWQDGLFGFASGGATLVETAGGGLLIAGLISGNLPTGWLDWRPLYLLGEWSYSFYLSHFAVERLVANTFPIADPVHGTAILAVGTVALTLPLSYLLYRYVELPSIRIGKAVTSPQ